jgi:hypothetical protein
MYGLPDSWAGYAAKKIIRNSGSRAKAAAKSALTGRQGKSYYFDKLIIYKPILDEFLNGPRGPVWIALEARTKKTVAQAKRQAGYRTGRLRTSIYSTHTKIPNGQMIKIGSDVEYAYMHHQGTRPHVILPKGDHEFLRFNAGTRIVYTRMVNHPGTRPNRFLSMPLRKNFSDIGTILEFSNQ